jgi:hypothetical protein
MSCRGGAAFNWNVEMAFSGVSWSLISQTQTFPPVGQRSQGQAI